MRTLDIHAMADPAHPEGGFAVVRLIGAETTLDAPHFRLRPLDGVDAGDDADWLSRRRQPASVRTADDVLELVIGPELVEDPRLTPGTPLVIELPDADVRGEFSWPSVAVRRAPDIRLRLVVPHIIEAPPQPETTFDQLSLEPAFTDIEPELVPNSRWTPPGANGIAFDRADPAVVGGGTISDFMAAAGREAVARQVEPVRDLALTDLADWVAPNADLAADRSGVSGPEAAAPSVAVVDRPDARAPVAPVGLRPTFSLALAATVVGSLVLGYVGYWGLVGFRPTIATAKVEAQTEVVPRATPPGTMAPPPALAAPTALIPASATLIPVQPGPLPSSSCGPLALAVEPLVGAQLRLRAASPCRAGEPIRVAYAGTTQVLRLSPKGDLDVALPLFGADSEAPSLVLADGSQHLLPLPKLPRGGTSMIALIWKRPVDLALHVYEDGARHGEAGHIARGRRGQSALGTIASWADAAADGDRVEVYSVAAPGPTTLAVAVDYATRGDVPSGATCTGGAFARVPFELVYRHADGSTQRVPAAFSPAACGTMISAEARFNRAVFPALITRSN